MSSDCIEKSAPCQPAVYQIRIEGSLGEGWADWFGGLNISLQENGETLLTGPVVDQSALFGLLKRVRDLGMTLVSVTRVEHKADASEGKSGASAAGKKRRRKNERAKHTP